MNLSDPDGKSSVDANMENSSVEEVTFGGADCYKGAKVIGCSGPISVDFLCQAVIGG